MFFFNSSINSSAIPKSIMESDGYFCLTPKKTIKQVIPGAPTKAKKPKDMSWKTDDFSRRLDAEFDRAEKKQLVLARKAREIAKIFTVHPAREVAENFAVHPAREVAENFAVHSAREVAENFAVHPAREVIRNFAVHPQFKVMGLNIKNLFPSKTQEELFCEKVVSSYPVKWAGAIWAYLKRQISSSDALAQVISLRESISLVPGGKILGVARSRNFGRPIEYYIAHVPASPYGPEFYGLGAIYYSSFRDPDATLKEQFDREFWETDTFTPDSKLAQIMVATGDLVRKLESFTKFSSLDELSHKIC